MKVTVLLFHVDRAPEFLEVEGAARYTVPAETEKPGEFVTYESFGKAAIELERDAMGDVETYAEVRTFAHPDIIETIKERGERREAHSPWGVVS